MRWSFTTEVRPAVVTLLPSTVARIVPAIRSSQQNVSPLQAVVAYGSFFPGRTLPRKTPEVLHLLDALPPDNLKPSATPTVQPKRHAEPHGTLAISSLESSCQEKDVAITLLCTIYFGRGAGSALGALVGCINTRHRDRQTRCADQSFPNLMRAHSPDLSTPPLQACVGSLNELFRPCGRMTPYACGLLGSIGLRQTRVGRAAAIATASFGNRIILEQLPFQEPNTVWVSAQGLET